MIGFPLMALPKGGRAPSCVGGRQTGQALLESCIVLAMFLLLWFALSWLGSLQDMGLSAQHAGRHAAFMHSRGTQGDVHLAVRRHFFSGPAHQWSSIDGNVVPDTVPDERQLHIESGAALPGQAQPGGVAPHAASLRHGWALHDPGITTAQISVLARASRYFSAPSGGSLASDAIGASWTLRRHTSVLTGAGHAENDSAAQKRVAVSRPGWADSAQVSYSLAQRITDRMGAVDAAWGRPLPRTDWLDLWEGAVPHQHLVEPDGGLHAR